MQIAESFYQPLFSPVEIPQLFYNSPLNLEFAKVLSAMIISFAIKLILYFVKKVTSQLLISPKYFSDSSRQ
jgi:hypothetical protein